jgi:hypothetical protein
MLVTVSIASVMKHLHSKTPIHDVTFDQLLPARAVINCYLKSILNPKPQTQTLS